MCQEKLDQELSELEQSLAEFSPQDARIDAVKVMFAAGRAAAEAERSSNTWWALATAASILLSIGMGIKLWSQPEARIVYVKPEKSVESVEKETPDPGIAEQQPTVEFAKQEIKPSAGFATDTLAASLLRKRNVAILLGIDQAWPDASNGRSRPQNPEDMSRGALEKQFQLRAFDRTPTDSSI